MRPYVATTGALFGLLTAMHLWRMTVEVDRARDPWYWLITVVAAGLALWAARALRASASR